MFGYSKNLFKPKRIRCFIQEFDNGIIAYYDIEMASDEDTLMRRLIDVTTLLIEAGSAVSILDVTGVYLT